MGIHPRTRLLIQNELIRARRIRTVSQVVSKGTLMFVDLMLAEFPKILLGWLNMLPLTNHGGKLSPGGINI